MGDTHAGGMRIFIGSGDASRLECQTLIHSLRSHSRGPLDITVFNGTRCTLERDGRVEPADPALSRLRERGFATEFSLFRYTIPDVCGGQGRALYLDSDMVCLADVNTLLGIPLNGCAVAARPDAYPEVGPERWATSAMVIDCAMVRFDLHAILDDIGRRLYTYRDFSQFAPGFLARHPLRIQAIPSCWNTFDRQDAGTTLIHYTDLATQPWRFRYHPHGEVWFRYFRDAIAAGVISEGDLRHAVVAGHVRPDIMNGNNGDDTAAQRLAGLLQQQRRAAGRFIRRTAARTLRAR
jgi:hypothetical protein